MKRTRVTSLDVAQAVGVSRSTVSRVLNGVAAEMVSAETRLRIVDKANELGYVPNAAARQLRKGRARSIGLRLPSLTHYLTGTYAFGEFLTGIAEITDEAGYSLVLCPAVSPERAVQMLPNGQVDGVLVMHPLQDDPALEALLALGAPVVLMNKTSYGSQVCWVDVDNEGGACRAVRHLLVRGHWRIGLITGRPGFVVTEMRLAGYRRALSAYGMPYDDSLVAFVPEPRLAPQGADGMRRLLSHPQPPTAVLCCPDQLALGALQAIREAGLRTPEDIAVVGFDDDPAASYERPRLTTVRGDLRGKARAAARMLIDLIEDRISSPCSVMLPMELIVRESS